jgi:uncharacterized protein (TIGR02466 family)
MNFDTVNIFPTTLYVGNIDNHLQHKEEFYKVYPKFDYERINKKTKKINTVSENQGNPLIHLEESLDPLFKEIVEHVKNYIHNILLLKDIFNVTITKCWLSRAREIEDEIPWHIHSTSHISFVYYVNMPKDSHSIKFLNKHQTNNLFLAMTADDTDEELKFVKSYSNENSETFFMLPNEGNLLLFPSKIPHSTKSITNNFSGERLAIVGDITLILKEQYLSYSMGYVDQKYWKTYN